MARKNYISGFGDKDPGAADFLKPSSTNPYEAEPSRNQYNARWDDETGAERGQQSRGGSQAWESRGADDSDFLRPSQTRTDHGDGRDSVRDIYSDVMPVPTEAGDMLGGSGPVREVGGGSGPPRFKPKSSKQARDDQSNDGL